MKQGQPSVSYQAIYLWVVVKTCRWRADMAEKSRHLGVNITQYSSLQ
jgi:hypothetical protein